jgi:DNA-binding PadR family transcriptional regulator
VDRSLRRIWPRARSKLYEEPKKLVALGYARAADERVGRRGRTRYTITPRGRRALRAWLHDPGAGPELEFEQLLKIHFCDSGTTDDVRANVDAALAWAVAQNEENLATARAYLAGESAFQERAALNLLSGRFLTDFYAMVAEWAQWAREVVAQWPDDPRDAPLDVAALEESVRVAERVASSASGEGSAPGRHA